MAHELSTADQQRLVLRKQAAWHKLGNVIPDDLSAVEAGEQFGFFDPITGWGLAAHSNAATTALESLRNALELGDVDAARTFFGRFESNTLEVNTHKANVMVTNKDGLSVSTLLGVVGAGYQTCQNRDLAEFTDALAQTGKVVIESAGTIQNGKRIFFLARGESFNIGGADKVSPYILVSNSHDGTSAIRVTPTTVRVVCSNTLHMVIPRNEDSVTRCDTAAICLRHSGDLKSKLDEARNAIKHYGQVLETNRALFEKLNAQKLDKDAALKFFAGQYTSFGWAVPTNDDLQSADAKVKASAERAQTKMDKAAKDFLTRWENEKSTTGAESAWLALNALTGVLQHDIASRGKNDAARIENRVKSNLFGVGADRAQQVFEAALAVAS